MFIRVANLTSLEPIKKFGFFIDKPAACFASTHTNFFSNIQRFLRKRFVLLPNEVR